MPEVLKERVDNPQSEWQKLQQAIKTAIEQLENLVNRESNESASIFTAHLLYLKDPELINKTHQIIFEQHLSAAAAWKTVIEELAASYQALTDPYLQARASDVEDVGLRVLRLLMGVSTQSIDFPQAGILVASDLTVSEIMQLKSGQVLGICLAGGSATAHSALLANQLGIPMIVGVGQDLLSIAANTELAIDGATGQIWSEPSDEQRQKLLFKSNLSQPKEILAEAITLDGKKIPVLANILGITNAQYALDCGAEGVGLLRTELLYLDRETPPTEEEQLETIEAIATIMDNRPLTIRTLDIGGDKPVAYLKLPSETNPFLGWRGIRQSLAHPEMLKTQLRAILQASAQHKIKLMFPTIASVTEVRAAKKLMLEVQTELKERGISFDEALEIGIMVEVPAAVTMADLLATEVDFFSIGTNDLSQYIMAADRTNPRVAYLADGFEPAVLRMIRQTVKAAHDAGIMVSVCGQLASEPTAVPILVGLGVDELSVNPPAIPAIKAEIARLRKSEAEAIATAVLQLDSATTVKEYVSNVAVQKQ
jgi:phosphocarrier protein FPr